MRIIAGKYRHRLINYPENNPLIRPTKDRVREAIYSSLGDISNKVVLDLFAGSGAMGIEALSRNAKECHFVDINDLAIKVIKDNIKTLGIDNGYIYHMDYAVEMKHFVEKGLVFDIIILDPPYASDKYIKIIEDIMNMSLLSDKGVIVVENNSSFNYDDFAFNKVKRYHYGKSNVDILWRN